MRLEVKALQMSLAIHTLLLLLVMIFSKDSLNTQKIVVIDLTLMEPVTAGVAVSDDKKMSAVYEPRTKHQKAASEDVNQIVEKKRKEIKEEKAETESKVTQDNENAQVDEQMPELETVPIVQDNEQNSGAEDQVARESAGIFLTSARETAENSSRDGGTLTTKIKQVFGRGNNNGVIKGYLESHLSYIKDIIQKNITYPNIAQRNGWMGKVKVSFVIAYNGYAKDIEVIQSSGFKILDKNAMEAVKHSSPFPKPPVEARIIIPILYELH